MACFKLSKAAWHSDVHLMISDSLFLVRSVRGAAIAQQF